MKKLLKHSLLFSIIIPFVIAANCDNLTKIPLNVPYEREVSVSGTDNNISESEFFCLDDAADYIDNFDNIETLLYVNAQYRTLSASPGLRGDLIIQVYQADGVTLLLQVTVPNVQPEDYIDNPIVIELSQAEINLINQYLALGLQSALCFNTVLSVYNITAGSTPYELVGVVEIVIEATVKL